jgi:hypothetical protein
MPGATEIPNYEPDDTAWGVVIGPFIRPEPQPTSDEDDQPDSEEGKA